MIEVKPLPYDYEALAPYISKETLLFHHDKHYVGYVNKVNELIKDTDFKDLDLYALILRGSADTVYTTLFNNAAQVFNHEFYFDSLTDNEAKKEVPSFLNMVIQRDFGSLEALKTKLVEQGVALFGSGYVWLVEETGRLKVVTSKNAELPLTHGFMHPLLAIDVWEHAYYLDRQNLRVDYLNAVVQNLINWHFVSENLNKVIKGG